MTATVSRLLLPSAAEMQLLLLAAERESIHPRPKLPFRPLKSCQQRKATRKMRTRRSYQRRRLPSMSRYLAMDHPTSQLSIPIVPGLVEASVSVLSHIKRQVTLIAMVLQLPRVPLSDCQNDCVPCLAIPVPAHDGKHHACHIFAMGIGISQHCGSVCEIPQVESQLREPASGSPEAVLHQQIRDAARQDKANGKPFQ